MDQVKERETLRSMVRGAYDLQKLRIQAGNRIVANYRSRQGQRPGTKEDDTLDEEGRKALDEIRAEYRRITDGVIKIPKGDEFPGTELIASYAEFCLVKQYADLDKAESAQFAALDDCLSSFPIWGAWLSHVRGVGPAMGGVLISEIDIAKARYPSSLWKFAGLDVVVGGAGRSRKADSLVEIAYKDKDGKDQTRRGITFNPFLKTKLIGVLASGFLRVKGSEYKPIYDNYKHRLECHPIHKDKTKGHRHNMAMRYMIKRFLVDLYKQWRTIEGLPVATEYSEGKLGIVHQKEDAA